MKAARTPLAEWYAVRSIFKMDMLCGEPVHSFEERVVLFRAASLVDALAKGKAEAKRYSEDSPHTRMLDHLLAFEICETELREGEEVWSCLRDLDTSDEEFLRRVYAGEMKGMRHAEQGDTE